MSFATTTDFYRLAAIATAAYVRLGDLDAASRTDGATFAARARGQDRLPDSIASALFDPAKASAAETQWSILSYYGADAPEFADDKSGFGATLFQNSATGEKVLAMRGTEPSEDLRADVFSADLGQIGLFGIALTQVVQMANYVMRLRAAASDLVPQLKVEATLTQPTSQPYVVAQGELGTSVYLSFGMPTFATGLGLLGPEDVVSVTGHSLGGHLAFMAARLFPDVFDPNVVFFNAPGYDPVTSDVLGLLDALSPFVDPALLFKTAIAGELGASALLLDTVGNELSTSALSKIYGLLHPNQPVDLGNPSVTSLISESVPPGDDFNVVSSSLTGIYRYGAPIRISTEPNSHLIEPFMDSLSLHALLYSMNDSLTLAETDRFFEAASRFAPDSEESLFEALYKVLKGSPIVTRQAVCAIE